MRFTSLSLFKYLLRTPWLPCCYNQHKWASPHLCPCLSLCNVITMFQAAGRFSPVSSASSSARSGGLVPSLSQVGGPDTDPPVLRDVTYVLERRRMGACFFVATSKMHVHHLKLDTKLFSFTVSSSSLLAVFGRYEIWLLFSYAWNE